MTISEFVQTTSAISAIIMIQIGAFWLKQFTRDAVRSRRRIPFAGYAVNANII